MTRCGWMERRWDCTTGLNRYNKAKGVRSVHESEEFCLRIGAHHAPSFTPEPWHQPDLKPNTASDREQVWASPVLELQLSR